MPGTVCIGVQPAGVWSLDLDSQIPLGSARLLTGALLDGLLLPQESRRCSQVFKSDRDSLICCRTFTDTKKSLENQKSNVLLSLKKSGVIVWSGKEKNDTGKVGNSWVW